MWFPFLPAERQAAICGVRDEPLVLTGKAGNAVCLSAVSRIASGLGLHPGLTLADARARIPQLVVVEADSDADAGLLRRLAAWADRFTPLVALDGADGLILDVTGCAGLFEGEANLRKTALLGLKRLGFSARASLAGTPDAAATLARTSRTAIVAEGGEAAAVAALPVSALGAGTETTRALLRAGLKTIGDLAARPSSALVSRFGSDPVRRLARLCGLEDTRLTPVRPLPQCRATRRFAEPMADAGALETVLHELLAEALGILALRGEGGLVFEAGFFRTDGEVRRIGVETGRASRDRRLIARLFAERMAVLADPIDPGFGFDTMTLSVPKTGKLAPAQADLEKDRDDSTLFDLVDQLVARFGQARVQSLRTEDTHMPERAMRTGRALTPQTGLPTPPEPDEPPLRPLHMLDPPHPIDVPAAPFPDGPPRRFRWRRVLHDVIAAEGPERIAPEWWRSGEETLTRDYFRVEDRDGRRFWIYRRGLYERETNEPRWYLHGLFA